MKKLKYLIIIVFIALFLGACAPREMRVIVIDKYIYELSSRYIVIVYNVNLNRYYEVVSKKLYYDDVKYGDKVIIYYTAWRKTGDSIVVRKYRKG